MEKARSFLVGNRPSVFSSAPSQPLSREWPTVKNAYELVEECGRGVSATVWRARLRETGEEVAVKLLDLENVNCSLEEIVREAQTMRQQAHPNVLTLHCSFVNEHQLWMVMPYVAGGSVLNIMKYAYPEGLEEPVIATILREVLKALDYVHRQGAIHRDVKAGNILIDSSGQVLLADFGVAAQMERGGSWGNSQVARNTFVGTPCWMAPEVMEQTQGYNSLADIWSFGITILELAHGHAPFARLPPMKVLLMTIQSPPPTLESDSGKKHFSKAMRDIVAKCLIKDPAKRPTAAQLLEHKFFKTAHESSYLVKHLLSGLPPVTERVRLMRAGKGHKAVSEQIHADVQSQEAYVRGVSAWNFDVAALKQAASHEGATDLATVPEEVLGANNSGYSNFPPPSGMASPASKPGTPVPFAASQSDYMPPNPILRSSSAIGSSAGDRGMGQYDRADPRMNISRSTSATTPGRERPAPGGGVSMKKKQGRFEVYEGDVGLSPPVTDGAALLDQHAASRSDLSRPSAPLPGLEGMDTEAEKVKEAKRKGRFQIVENEDKARLPKSQAGSGDGSKTGMFSPTNNPASNILNPLKAILDGYARQYEALKELVAAVQDAERGRSASLASLLAQYTEKAPNDVLTTKTELMLAKEENHRLKERMRVMEEELQRSRNHMTPEEIMFEQDHS